MRSKRSYWRWHALLALIVSSSPGSAHAGDTRAVLLVSQTIDGSRGQAQSLEAAGLKAFTKAGLRAIELDSALASQAALFSDMIQAGKLPPALSTLNADALVSLAMSCDKSTEKLLGTAFQSYFCVLNTKVVRVDAGEVEFSRSERMTGHGLSPAMALDSLLRDKVPDALASQSQEWLSRWNGAAGFSVDLVVAGVPERSLRERLYTGLSHLPGVTDVREVYVRDGIVKLTLKGVGETELHQLPAAIEASSTILHITREAGRTLYAQLDPRKAFTRDAVVYVELPSNSDAGRELIEEIGPDVVQSALRQLPYLKLLHSRPVAGPARGADSIAAIVSKGRGPQPQLVVTARVRRDGAQWMSVLTAQDALGTAIGTGSGTSDDLAEAVQTSARVLDEEVLAALSSSLAREGANPAAGAQSSQPGGALVVERFRVRGERDGLLSLRNTSNSLLSDCRVELKVAGIDAGQVDVADLPAGKARSIPLAFTTLPEGLSEDPYTQVSATIRYRAGEAYGDTQAAAIWMRPGDVSKAPRPVGDKHAPKAYADLTKRGVIASRAGQWDQAKLLFLEAHRLYPTARTLRALGMVSFDLAQYQEADRYLRAALASKVRTLTPTLRSQLNDLLNRTTVALAESGSVAVK